MSNTTILLFFVRALNSNRNCIEAQRMIVMYTLCRDGKYSEVNDKKPFINKYFYIPDALILVIQTF